MKLIISIIIFIPIFAFADNFPTCEITKEADILFSNSETKDRLIIKIKGNPCYEGELTINIRNIQGKILYNYSARFEPHTAIPWNDPKLDYYAEQLADQLSNKKNFETSNFLPLWQPKSEYFEENYQELKVLKAYYEKLRKMDWVTFSHYTHYEKWRIIVFDREQQKVVLVSAGGL